MRSFYLPAALALVLALPLSGQQPQALSLSGDYPITHDPSIAHEGDTYYVFATTSNAAEGQFPVRCCSHHLYPRYPGESFGNDAPEDGSIVDDQNSCTHAGPAGASLITQLLSFGSSQFYAHAWTQGGFPKLSRPGFPP